ncbi:heterokaryon incompatibility protein-domain-containing protein [Apiosordaria backusii]|uniref:Heterokaryon incompatibility protein-domain-containing protein n=1 Tax=Apiosordaria backusii TaxID=314023 RepID=A0AA40BEC4_9PEZI|nr:heterokaryon incompatibility protein-domain-containing protein [Apiosordaria backusii]
MEIPQASLCDRCREIPFLSLSCPTRQDLDRALDARKHNRQNLLTRTLPLREKDSKEPKVSSKIELGSLEQIERSAQSCDLCALIWSVVQRQGGIYEGNVSIPRGDEMVCCIRTDPRFGYVTDSLMDGEGVCPDTLVLLCRMSMTIEAADNRWIPLAWFDQFAQACNPGVLLSPANARDDGMLFAGRKISEIVDLTLLRRWIDICDSDHENTCLLEEEENLKRFKRIRMIDVRQNCIKTFENTSHTEIKYVALSYVWGRSQRVMLTTASKPYLERPGFFGQDLDVPQTIADALVLTEGLGMDYLWVDALCIVQDDTDDLKLQIGNAANIYRAASLTLVASSGLDCNAGLAGLRPGTRASSFKQQEVVVIPPGDKKFPSGLSLVTTCRSQRQNWPADYKIVDDDLDLSVWTSRGWTLQERVLSRRNLVFTNEQVIWVCDGGYFCEESCFEPPPSDKTTMSPFKTPLRVEPFGAVLKPSSMKSISGAVARDWTSRQRFWEKYGRLVEMYTRRNFTYPGDMYDGFRGISAGFQTITGEELHWGHPRSRFELSLSWRSTYGLYRRTELSTLPMTSLNTRVTFPSWSWMGWKGQVEFEVTDERLETESPAIVCFVHKTRLTDTTSIVPASRPSQGYMQAPEPLKKKHIGHGFDLRGKMVSLADIHKHLPKLHSRLFSIPNEHVLFFWANCVPSRHFELEVPPELLLKEKSPTIADWISQARPAIKNLNGAVVGSLDRMVDPEYWKVVLDDTGGDVGFVVVGRRHVPDLPQFPAMLLVLQVRWNGDGDVTERLNIGEIEEEAWPKDGQAEVKLISLM